VLQLAAHTTRQHAVLTATVVQRGGPGAGAISAGAVDARRHDKVRPESDGRLQPADTPEEHRTVRGVRRLRWQRRRSEQTVTL